MPTNKNRSAESTRPKSLRLWPGIVAAILLVLLKLVVPKVLPDALPVTLMGGPLFALIIIAWWTFFSRAPRLDRWGGALLIIIALVGVRPLLHASIAEAGLGMLFPILALPYMGIALVAWAVLTRRLSKNLRRATMAATILLASGAWAFLRTGGINNDGESDFSWRWTPSSEERLLTQTEKEQPVTALGSIEAEAEPEWPGFRGSRRDGIVRGVCIETDWSAFPPEEIWRRPVGPGWSSFAVYGDRFYTQEQRGEEEVVSCYDLNTGEPIWLHGDQARFWESNGGAGPRGTPTLSNGRVYTLGGTGIVNVLDAADGSVIWTRNAGTDTDTKVPVWGFSGSPWVTGDLVIVAAAGSLIAYDQETGEPRWSKSIGGDCYSSPHLLEIAGVPQILLQNETGAIGVTPADGRLLWEHAWEGHPIVQPTLTADGDVLVSVGDKSGIRCIAAVLGGDGWSVQQRWTSTDLTPYFNDTVIRNGHAYGFDGPFLACIGLEDGTRNWKGGRYGRGQVILLEEQGLLIVLSEKGNLALVEAIPDGFTELARVPALSGKTWNHPVLVGGILLVRNAQEMAAFRLRLVAPA